MNHSFDIAHAKEYGLPEAILINNFQFWIAKNRANGRHQHEGRTWTYNTAKALAELLPYLSDRQIRRALDSLVDQGVLLKGNFNSSTYDRTLWFAFSDECIFQIRRLHSPDSANGKADSGDSETDINTDKKQIGEKPAQALAIPPALLADFLSVRKAKRAGPLTATAIDGLQREADKAGISLEAAVTACCEFGWQGFNAGWYADRAPKHTAMTANRQTETAHMRQEREVAQGLAPNVARVKLVPTFDFVEMEKNNVTIINRN